jgi:hypothetical protein
MATATVSPTATALADTGGPPIAPLSITLALMVSGIVALALLRRRGAS